MKYLDIDTKSDNEIMTLLNELQTTLGKLRFDNSRGALPKNHQLGDVRRDIARVRTVMRARRSHTSH